MGCVCLWAQDKVQAAADEDGGSGVDWASVDMGDEEPRRRMCRWRPWILLELWWQWLAGGVPRVGNFFLLFLELSKHEFWTPSLQPVGATNRLR